MRQRLPADGEDQQGDESLPRENQFRNGRAIRERLVMPWRRHLLAVEDLLVGRLRIKAGLYRPVHHVADRFMRRRIGQPA